MYEYHGWANIRENTFSIEEDEDNISSIIESIRQYISSLKWNSGLLDICPVNGEYHLILTGFSNHSYVEKDIINLYNFVAEISPGSYGLLYVHDDEDMNGNDNSFSVFVLTRGSLRRHKDPFLSPFIPVVEDYDES